MEYYLFLENRHPNIQVFLSLNKATYSKDRSYRFGACVANLLMRQAYSSSKARPKPRLRLPVGFPSSIDIVDP